MAKEPKEWGIVGATVWGFAAFFLPQFALVPVLGIVGALSLDQNAKIFLLQGFTQLITLLVLWLVIVKLYRSKLTTIGLGKLNPGLLGWSVLAFPVYLILSTALSSIFAAVFNIDLSEHQDIGYTDPNGYELALIFVALVVLAPLVEEILFRGFLFTAFRRTFGFWLGAIGVSLLFAVAHGQANVGIDVFVLSMFLCYLREKTDSLWPAVALHALKNLVAFIVLFIMKVN
ncbi:MAG TPA: type II CAAX endopeptidase family protein [Candidatus Saccharimonadales bacterium]|nr:type II CAAX endopeptidase family protein [Candidatus Saccharimonadales bacterium]